MLPLDLFVGSVAIVFGLWLLTGAIVDGAWLMTLAKPRLLVGALGKSAARALIGLVGLGLIALGVAIARGWRVQW